MKKALALFLVVLTIALGILTLSSCKARREKIDLISYYDGGTEIIPEYGKRIIRFYIDPASGYDVADFEDVRISFKYEESISNYKSVTKDAMIPDGARGNPELQYFYVVLDTVNMEEDRPLLKVEAKGRYIEEIAEEKEEEEKDSRPSIFTTILSGLGLAIIAIITSCFGLAIRGDPRGWFIIAASIIFPIVLNIVAYVYWGAARGVIISVCCAIIIAATVIGSKFIDY